MAAFATLEDYEARNGSVTDAARVQAMLDDASAMIRSKLPRGFTPDTAVARALTVVVARRSITNPGGFRQRTIGQYSETLGEAGGLYVTEGEIESLLGDAMGDGDAAYSVICDVGPAWVPAQRDCW